MYTKKKHKWGPTRNQSETRKAQKRHQKQTIMEPKTNQSGAK